MPTGRLPWKGLTAPFIAAAMVLLLAPSVVPPAGGWETQTRWDGGIGGFTIDSDLVTGGRWDYNFSLPRNSEVRIATMRVEGRPYIMDPGEDFQTLHWPRNPSLDLLGDGTPDWEFPGTMGLQQDLAPNITELALRWESFGLTKHLDIKIPKSTVNEFSLSISNQQTSKYAYSMSVGDRTVWQRESLNFSYNQTAFTKETLNYITTADINGDPWPDLVGCGANGKVYVSRSINGRFGNATVIDCQVPSAEKDMLMVAAGDLDGNPGLDLAAACADGNIYILLNQGGAGLFGSAAAIESGVASRMASVCVEDVDVDGFNDVVAGNLNGKFYVFFNAGGAQFDTSGGPGSAAFKVVNAGSGQMNGVRVADINQDTWPDLVGACANRQYYVVFSLDARDFDNAYPVVTGALRDMVSVDAVDIDKDGDFDLVGASLDGKMYICVNLGNAQGQNPADFDTQPGHIVKIACESGTDSLRTSVVKDVNGDEWPDIVALGTGNSGQVHVILNDAFGMYPDANHQRPFSAGQSSKGIAAASLVRQGYVDLVAANGNRIDIWKSNQGPFGETIGGPVFVQAAQSFIDNATTVPDKYGNPWVTLRLAIYSRYSGQLHFSDLSVNYTYNALVDFTSALSAHLNRTAGPAESPVECPVVFRMDSAGTLAVSELHIESQIGLVALIDFPSEGAVLYKDRSYTLQGRSNYDPDGTLFNYTWTDLSSGRLLGYGSQVSYTPNMLGNLTIQLRTRNDLSGKVVVSTVHVRVVEEPAANLAVTKVVATPESPRPGETVSLKVTIKNTGKVNATNVGIQVYLDRVRGLPVASGVIPRVDMARAATVNVSWKAGAAGAHEIIVVIAQADQAFTTSVQPHQVGLVVKEKDTIDKPVIAYGTIIGLGAAAAAVAAFFLTEIGKYLGLSLFMPLYSKLRPEEVLDKFIRGKILGYIRANPGAHYNLIKQDLELHNGTLIHHLDTLERNGFVRSARDGTLKRFFPGDGKVPEGRIYLNPIQESMRRYVEANPGVSQAELSRGLFMEPHIVKYHVKVLRDAELLQAEEDGNRTRLFLR
jgi:DNA-binding MarR family transcriptional regulator